MDIEESTRLNEFNSNALAGRAHQRYTTLPAHEEEDRSSFKGAFGTHEARGQPFNMGFTSVQQRAGDFGGLDEESRTQSGAFATFPESVHFQDSSAFGVPSQRANFDNTAREAEMMNSFRQLGFESVS